MNRVHAVCCLIAVMAIIPINNSLAAILFESGTLGPTGIPRSQVTGGSNVGPDVFVGVRFHLDQPVLTTQIGGHFVKDVGTTESFFGAIVALTSENDFPDSGSLSTPDVVGTTQLAFPVPSDEVFGAISKPLNPGWYALVFGSGLFGTTGSGVAVNNGVDIGSPTYIGFQPLSGVGWIDLNLLHPIFRDYRFVVHGYIVPEPATIVPASIVLLPLLFLRFRKHKQT